MAWYSDCVLQQDDPFSTRGKSTTYLSRKLLVKLTMTKIGIEITICIRNFTKRLCWKKNYLSQGTWVFNDFHDDTQRKKCTSDWCWWHKARVTIPKRPFVSCWCQRTISSCCDKNDKKANVLKDAPSKTCPAETGVNAAMEDIDLI